MFRWQVESSMLKCSMSGKEKAIKKNGILAIGQLKKVKILGDKVKVQRRVTSFLFIYSLLMYRKAVWFLYGSSVLQCV